MNDAQNPVIRDPHAPASMVGGASDARSAADNASDPFTALGSGSAAASASPNVIDPLAGLGSPARGPSLGLDDLDPLDSGEIDRGLAKLDPLAVRPRISSRVLCAVFGLLLIAAGFGIWWVCVFTEDGQSYDELVWKNLVAGVPGAVGGLMSLVAQSWLVIAISCLLAVIGVVSALVRRRWWLVGQIVVFAAVCLAVTRIKGVLPRPFIINTDSPAANSAPSGHTMLAAACAVILLLAVPRAARALAGIIGVIWSWTVGVSVIYGQWHRPSDVAMSILLVAGLALIVLVFTRTSGMDEPGSRVSSVSVQIVGSVLITGGLLLLAYSAYVIWQVVPGLNISASWAVSGSIVSAIVGVAGVAALTFGLLLALRHITAAPLSRLGLIGAPPAPPKR
ncbi:phosphatase PAP2 family protein [Bifidobacterium breve]|uniref:phosphatase PAP2 family protein n=1 Tax=Bifidobacterium breve TaxID=1685 RepID=UPI000699A0EE|nr:phosphatase PAP2 family protein [Bifidobacterium breve]GDZ58360.1 PAP2 family phosphoesterase [Bifidobacteriaceae bacterium MCC01967]GDZ63552.1 PAP2 family phosphoesterase [Bifidobacteriaceae bacterium MCC02038]